MKDQEVLELLRKIDLGYKPTEAEYEELAGIETITWKQIENIPDCIDILNALRELDVSGNPLEKSNLMAIPERLGNLSSLRSLDLSRSKISTLPESIGNLSSLQSLDLSRLKISTLPESIGKLSSLQSLDLSRSKISTLPESIGNLSSLQTLDLRLTQVSMLPESIGNLPSLQSLNLSRMKIRMLPGSAGNLTSLQSLNLSRTKISTLPESTGNLTSLRSLDLSRTKIDTLPESIGNLTSLQSLYLSDTQIRTLPESIGDLTSLQSLNLGWTQIRTLPESIGNLTSLWSLDLSNTQISALPESIGTLSSLQSLYLSLTQIRTLPESIGNLTSLQNLDLSGAQITTLPESIGNLMSLQSLDLSNTQITTLPESIGNLTSLQSLDLSGAQITALPESIGNLTSLQSLDLSRIPINEFPKNIATLPELKRLTLENLTLFELSEELLPLNLDYKNVDCFLEKKDPGIYIRGLRLQKQPVSLFYQPRKLIIDYYSQPRILVNETKVIFLGSEGVGKTHTIKRILNDNHKIDENLRETPGISITSKEFSIDNISYRINFWDFGGQEIMHAMHRCFLTDRTGYVVVVSTRFGDVNKQARYWLRSIESFTNDAPVVIFVNEWSKGTYYQIDEVSLRRDYPNITTVRQCSAKDGEDAAFAQVVRTIQDMALANDSISMSFPESWEKVRQKIIALGRPDSQKYYISQEEFREECRNNGIENEDIQTWLLDWFNDLGECFSYEFDEERQDLKKDLKVLDPAWLTNAIYIIIREAGDLALNGIVPHEGIQKKLDHSDKGTLKGVSYDADECDYVLEVMRKFRLSYKISGKRQEFIPALLRDKMPADLQPTDANNVIFYEMRYKYLPENVIHNLMIAMYPYLDHERCWRKGMVIDVRKILSIGLYAVLDMSREDEILRIKVYSFANHAPWQLLQEIRARLLDINSRMNLEAQDYIIIDPEHIAEAVSVEKLLKLKKRGKTQYEGDDRDYEINDLLGQTFGDEQVRRMETVDSSGERDSDRKSDEYRLREMRDALNQPAEKGILNFADQLQCTCEVVCEYLISACTQIQSNPLYWKAKEDSRSMQVRDILSNRNLLIRDQTLYGHAPNSNNPGEVDLMIMKNATDPLTIIEAMNIDSVETVYVQGHLHKLLDDYNPSGLPELFLVAYVQKPKRHFPNFWESYRSFIEKTDAGDFKVVDIQDFELEVQYIKHALVHYECGGARFAVHHICMRAGD